MLSLSDCFCLIGVFSLQEKVNTKIEKILKAKQKPNSSLEKESFAKYMESVGNFMTSVYETFKTPVLTLVTIFTLV